MATISDDRGNELAVKNDWQQSSLLASNEAGTRTKRIVVDSEGRIITASGDAPDQHNPDGSLVTAAKNSSYTYTYDASGNVTQIDRDDGTEAYRKTFTYDADGNLLTASAWAAV